jgi:hypothetical protein
MGWLVFDNGGTIAQRGSEQGVVIRDDENEDGARITLERDCKNAPFSITCGIYGSFFHTRFFRRSDEANAEFDLMKDGLAAILAIVPVTDDPEQRQLMYDAIDEFVDRFP